MTYETIEKQTLNKEGYKYISSYGDSQLWVNKEKGLLLDTIKNNSKVFEIRFKYIK